MKIYTNQMNRRFLSNGNIQTNRSACESFAVLIVNNCWATTDKTSTSIRLNLCRKRSYLSRKDLLRINYSSKQHHDPKEKNETKIEDIAETKNIPDWTNPLNIFPRVYRYAYTVILMKIFDLISLPYDLVHLNNWRLNKAFQRISLNLSQFLFFPFQQVLEKIFFVFK